MQALQPRGSGAKNHFMAQNGGMYVSEDSIVTVVSMVALLIALGGGFAWVVQRMDGLSKNVDTKIQALDANIGKLTTDVDTKIQALNTSIRDLTTDVDAVKNDVETLRKDFSYLRDDVSVLRKDLDILRRDVDTLGGDVAGLREEIKVLRQDLKEVQTGELPEVLVGAWQHTHTDEGSGFEEVTNDHRYVFPTPERMLYCQHVPDATEHAENAADVVLNDTTIELPGGEYAYTITAWDEDTLVSIRN